MTSTPDEAVALRDGRADDLEFLFALFKVSLGPYVEQTYGPWQEDAQRQRFFQLTNPAAHQIVECGGEPIGCLNVERSTDALELHRVFLLPAFQRRGIGSRLVRRLLAEAESAGLPVRLRVLRVNPAQRLYARLGFAVIGQTETHVLMEWRAVR
jgi:GNAT superfamily N-acetyltransferase